MQLVELVVPALIILLIGSIKSTLNVEEIAEGIVTTDTPVATFESMQDVATFPNVLCYDNNMFLRYYLAVDDVYSNWYIRLRFAPATMSDKFVLEFVVLFGWFPAQES